MSTLPPAEEIGVFPLNGFLKFGPQLIVCVYGKCLFLCFYQKSFDPRMWRCRTSPTLIQTQSYSCPFSGMFVYSVNLTPLGFHEFTLLPSTFFLRPRI